ncbi:MAG: hypothetical protein PVSMB6_16570 [Steroidobacteraceae bacterium]
MRFRLQAFGLHLTASAGALTIVLGALYLGWYRWPGWYLTGGLHVLLIVAVVDLALGPTLTLIIANPGKPRRALARDITVIVAVQVVALGYGAATLWQGRPLYYTFSADRLEMAQASDLAAGEIALAQRQNPAFAPHWYSLPRWVWAPLPDNPEDAGKIVSSAVFGGGPDVIDMPRYFRPWSAGLPKLRGQLTRVEDCKYLSKSQKQSLSTRMRARGLAPDEPNTLIMWGEGGVRRLVAVFDPATVQIKAILSPD